MTSIKQEANIIEYRKSKHANIGIIIFGFILLYLVGTILLYVFKTKVSVYEVRRGSILKDNAYTGLALRDEIVVKATDEGYINFFTDGGSKVKVGSEVYAVTGSKIHFDSATPEGEFALSSEDAKQILLRVQSFNEQFREDRFSTVYPLKEEITHIINKNNNRYNAAQLESMEHLNIHRSETDGVLFCSVDGMEQVTLDNFKVKQLHKSNYKRKTLAANSKISEGDTVYRIVRSNDWNLLVEVSEETAKILKDRKRVKVNFKKDNQEVYGQVSVTKKEGHQIACITFNHSMVRYGDDRYLDVELVLDDETGLKIPKSARTTKDFYVVPTSYLVQGGNGSKEGVMVEMKDGGSGTAKYMNVTVYLEKDDYAYLDVNVFEKGDVLIKPDSSERYKLSEKKSLDGVYSINKGYAVFKQIVILCESDEYYIVEEGNSFGLSNYDHIALNSSKIKENDVVF